MVVGVDVPEVVDAGFDKLAPSTKDVLVDTTVLQDFAVDVSGTGIERVKDVVSHAHPVLHGHNYHAH